MNDMAENTYWPIHEPVRITLISTKPSASAFLIERLSLLDAYNINQDEYETNQNDFITEDVYATVAVVLSFAEEGTKLLFNGTYQDTEEFMSYVSMIDEFTETSPNGNPAIGYSHISTPDEDPEEES